MFLFQPDFSAAVRTLTGLGGALSVQSSPNGSLAAASTLAFNQVAGKALINTAAAIAAAGGTVVIQFVDGTNTWTVTTIAAGTTGGQDSMYSANTVNWQFHNNAPATAVAIWWCGFALVT